MIENIPELIPNKYVGTFLGGTAGAGPARGGWPLPACGEPMRIKPHHQTSRVI